MVAKKPGGSVLTTDQTCEQQEIDERGVQPPEQPKTYGTATGLTKFGGAGSHDKSGVAREALLAARTLFQEKVRQRKAESVLTVQQWHRAQQFQNHRRAREHGDHAQSFLLTVASLSEPKRLHYSSYDSDALKSPGTAMDWSISTDAPSSRTGPVSVVGKWEADDWCVLSSDYFEVIGTLLSFDTTRCR